MINAVTIVQRAAAAAGLSPELGAGLLSIGSVLAMWLRIEIRDRRRGPDLVKAIDRLSSRVDVLDATVTTGLEATSGRLEKLENWQYDLTVEEKRQLRERVTDLERQLQERG